jgi:hypothetical protein
MESLVPLKGIAESLLVKAAKWVFRDVSHSIGLPALCGKESRRHIITGKPRGYHDKIFASWQILIS